MVVYLLFESGDMCRLVDGRSKGGEEKKKMVNNDDNKIGTNTERHSCAVEWDQRPSFLKKPLMVWSITLPSLPPHTCTHVTSPCALLRFKCKPAERFFFFCLHQEALKPPHVDVRRFECNKYRGRNVKVAFCCWLLWPAAVRFTLSSYRTIAKSKRPVRHFSLNTAF